LPLYTFKNKETQEYTEVSMKMSELDEYKKNNPLMETVITGSTSFSYSSIGDFDKKSDNTWKEVLQKIGEQNPSTPLADKYVQKTAKQIKTKEIIRKHIDLQTR